MKLRRTGAQTRGMLSGCIVTLLALALLPTRFCEQSEEVTRDGLASLRGRPALSSDLVLMTIGETASRALSGAVPRTAHARVLEALSEAGAQTLVYDIPLSQEGRDGPEGSALLAKAAADSKRTLFPLLCDEVPQVDAPTLRAQLLPRALDVGLTPARKCPGAVTPLGPLAEAATLGHLEANAKVPLFVDVLGMRIPSMGLAAYAQARELPLKEMSQGKTEVRLGKLVLPVDESGQVPVRFRQITPNSTLAYEEFLAGIEDAQPPVLPAYLAERVRGRIVMVAQLGQGTQADPTWKRVWRFASHLSDLLDERPPRSLSLGGRLGLAFGAGLLGTLLGLFLTGRRAFYAGGALALIALLLPLVLSESGLFVGPLGFGLTGLLALAVAHTAKEGTLSRQRRALETAFAPYVSAETLQHILEAKTAVSLSGTERNVTVLYCDLGSVAQLVGEQPAVTVLDSVRRAILELGEQVTKRGGRIERVLGDGILAVFGDPLPDENHAHRAVDAGLSMLEVGWRRAAEQARGRARLSVRVAVASGKVVAGALGGVRGAFVYGVVGEPVQQALRIQSRTPAGALLVSQATKEACGDHFEFIEVPAPLLRGVAVEGPAFLAVGKHLEFDPERKAARLAVDAQVRVQGRGVVGSGRVLDVSAGGMRLRADVQLSLGDRVDVEFSRGAGPHARPVRVTGEVRHAEVDAGATTVGMTVDRAETPGTAAHVFAALFLGATKLDADLGLVTRSGDVFDTDGDTLVRRG